MRLVAVMIGGSAGALARWAVELAVPSVAGFPSATFLINVTRQGLAGATVLRGIEGFGAASRIHTSRILALSEDLPLVIEIVDAAEKVEAFLAAVDDMLSEGLVTMERVEVRA